MTTMNTFIHAHRQARCMLRPTGALQRQRGRCRRSFYCNGAATAIATEELSRLGLTKGRGQTATEAERLGYSLDELLERHRRDAA
jgi:hypothetical protein